MVVRLSNGTVVVAGQTHASAVDFAAEAAADLSPGGWLAAILALDPRRVLFAHDRAVWVP
jgi:N-acyl homoserine lactone hydrolase